MGTGLLAGIARATAAIVALSAPPPSTPAPPAVATAAPARITTAVPYGHTASGEVLRLDLFRPAVASRRTAVIWLHGSGPPAPRSRIGYYAGHFAALGYVSATIDYSEGRELDAMAAVRWVRRRAASLGVRTDHVFLGGYSSGAIASVGAGEHGHGLSRPDGVISISGYGEQSSVARGSSPLLMIHGDRDRNVPYALARQTCAVTRRAGVACQFVTLRGAAHAEITYQRRFAIWAAVDQWMRRLAIAPGSGGSSGGTSPD